MTSIKRLIALPLLLLACMVNAVAQRSMEYLNRGVYAINQGDGKVL